MHPERSMGMRFGLKRAGAALAGVVAVFCFAAAGGEASAQTATEVRVGGAGARAPESGVSLRGFGGVRSKAPAGIGRRGSLLDRTGTLLPPSQQREAVRRAPVRHAPGIVVGGRRPTVIVGPGVVQRSGSGVFIGGDFHDGGVGIVHERRSYSHFRTTGVTVRGRYEGDRFRLGFRIGSPLIHRHVYRHPVVCFKRPVYYGWSYWRRPSYTIGGGWMDDPFVRYGETQQVYTPPPVAQQERLEPVRELTAIDYAWHHLRAGEADAAVRAFREHLRAEPQDADAVRGMALALMESRKFEEAIALMAHAYEMDPSLAWRPIDPNVMPRGERGVRQHLSRMVQHAHRLDTASSWLMVTVLMQAEGRENVALRMLDRARDKGLRGTVGTEMWLALRPV